MSKSSSREPSPANTNPVAPSPAPAFSEAVVSEALTVRPFELEEWVGEMVDGLSFELEIPQIVELLVDPGSATETVHWGRNYLYRVRLASGEGPVDLVVKQFRSQGRRQQLDRQLRGSKAARSWRMAMAFAKAGIPTAAPVMLIESRQASGPTLFVTRHIPNALEARYIFRAAREGRLGEDFPGFDYPRFLGLLGESLARMHGAGLFHRDMSIGNVLMPRGKAYPERQDLVIIDLNRARLRPRGVGMWDRNRDLCRLTIHGWRHQERFLKGYWGRSPNLGQRVAYALFHHGFFFKIGAKKLLRAPFRRLADHLRPRRAHLHIPDAPDAAGMRDKIVWDHLSDQPHQHASRMEKLRVRVLDAPSHLMHAAILVRALPRMTRRYLELRRELYSQPLEWAGCGVCVRPYPEAPEDLLAAVEDLGLRHVLLRLHPWQETHEAELELAEELHERGHEVVYALPQNRDLVRDPALWRRRVEEIAEIFLPYGRTFQVGQAVNRSKWGIWRYGEYIRLAREACEILRRHQGARVLGPAVIDFELHSTAAIVNRRDCPELDALASLLYVDRRGAPENRQLGFDTVGKALLTRAIADTARSCGSSSWVTEVNWPLREGPHSPAGKSVAVSEQEQADYLTRYYLQTLTSGAIDRVYWWQMIARGYGLIAPQDPQGGHHGLRRRPAFAALRTLEARLAGSRFVGRLESPAGTWLLRFEIPIQGSFEAPSAAGGEAGETWIVGWTEGLRQHVGLPEPLRNRPVLLAIEQDGETIDTSRNGETPSLELLSSTRYFRI